MNKISIKTRLAFTEMYLVHLGKREKDFREWIKSNYPEIEGRIFSYIQEQPPQAKEKQ